MSVRCAVLDARGCVPIPLLSSAATQASTTSPRSGTPARRSASVAMMQAVTPAFMLKMPWPKSLPSAIHGSKGSRVQPRRERVDVDVAVQHDRPAAAGAPAGARWSACGPARSPAAHLEPLVAQVVGEPLRAGRLLGGERRDPDQIRASRTTSSSSIRSRTRPWSSDGTVSGMGGHCTTGIAGALPAHRRW